MVRWNEPIWIYQSARNQQTYYNTDLSLLLRALGERGPVPTAVSRLLKDCLKQYEIDQVEPRVSITVKVGPRWHVPQETIDPKAPAKPFAPALHQIANV